MDSLLWGTSGDPPWPAWTGLWAPQRIGACASTWRFPPGGEALPSIRASWSPSRSPCSRTHGRGVPAGEAGTEDPEGWPRSSVALGSLYVDNQLPAADERSGRGATPPEHTALKCLYLDAHPLEPTGSGRYQWAMVWMPAPNALHHRLRPYRPQQHQLNGYTENRTVREYLRAGIW
jgi:hypothetical protein